MRLYVFILSLFFSLNVYSAENISAEEVADILNRANSLYQAGKIEDATKEYRKILDFHMKISKDDRFRMAKVFSWTGHLRESLLILNKLYEEYPEDTEIAIVYSRVLSWNGEFEKPLNIIDKVLEKEPNNVDALLIKANIYRWGGEISKSIYYYEKIFSIDPSNFDAKISYGYALLSLDRKRELYELLNSLEPRYDYQQKDYTNLKVNYLIKFNPSLLGGYFYYHDSDHNNTERLVSQLSFWLKNTKLTFDYRKYLARGSDVSLDADEYLASMFRRINSNIDWSISFGNIKTSSSKDFIIGGISTNIKIDKTLLNFSFNSRLLTDTPFLIYRQIRLSSFSTFLNSSLTDRTNLYISLSSRFYSDSNTALFLQIAPVYKVISANPSLSIGYRVIYLTFKDHKRNGYFDPKDYISNQLFFPIYFEKDRLTLYIEPYIGQQTFKRYGKSFSDTIIGGYSTVEYKVRERLYLSGSLEGGNYSLGTASGWKYYIIGVNLRYIF